MGNLLPLPLLSHRFTSPILPPPYSYTVLPTITTLLLHRFHAPSPLLLHRFTPPPPPPLPPNLASFSPITPLLLHRLPPYVDSL